jgi:pyruvate formate lyase activating enzyme
MDISRVLKQAVLWDALDQKKVRCRLCHHRCLIKDDGLGRCGVRKNIDGMLFSLNYDRLCAAQVDPIEKKPLFHFLPGAKVYSIATEGCNFQCEFCQNWQISQSPVETGRIDGQPVTPERIVEAALEEGCAGLAYTYTEPTLFMELAADCGRLAKQQGLANVFVSNGYMTPEAVDFAGDWLDGINVDLKAFNEGFYKSLCKARFSAVLETIEYIAHHSSIWMEVTTLIVPGRNDSEDELKALADFLVHKAGPQVPWHVSRFHPQYKMTDVGPTPVATLTKAYEIGKAAGLHYVYVGNVPGSDHGNTLCHQCGHQVVERLGYTVVANRVKGGACPNCGTPVAGIGWAKGQSQ